MNDKNGRVQLVFNHRSLSKIPIMKTVLFSLMCCVFVSTLHAQEQYSGKLTSTETIAFSEIVVSLYSKDSLLMASEFALVDGTFYLSFEPCDSCFLVFDGEDIIPFKTALIVLDSLNLGSFEVQKIKQATDEVVVQAKKPFLERKPGMVVVNAQESVVATGLSAFEFLEKLPGVRIDANENIFLNGKGGIIVQINGKNLPQSGQDLANYLRGIPSSMIDKIELISNPSAKFDAAGVAIINILLKKDQRLGTNGTLNIGGGHGYYPKMNAGASINHRTKKINLYASYNFARRIGMNDLKLDRYFYANDTLTGGYLQDNFLLMKIASHNFKSGLDWQLNPKNALRFGVTGLYSQFKVDGHNHSDVLDSLRNLSSTFETFTTNNDSWGSIGGTVSFQHILDTLNSEWTVDLDYSQYGHQSKQDINSFYYQTNGQQLQNPYLLQGSLNGTLNLWAGKTDLKKYLSNNYMLETGAKVSYVVANNNLQFNDISSGQAIYDSTKSNHYIYNETISAAYVMVHKSYKKWSYQLGLRGELSHIKGEQRVYNLIKDTLYFQLFPSLAFKFGQNENHQFDVTISRRIDRPSYDQLNPFKFYLDPTTYKAGNPALGPQTTLGMEVSYMLNQRHIFTAAYGRTTNNITEIIAPVAGQSNLTAQTMINLATVDVASLAASLNFDVQKWWNTMINLNTYYASYSGNAAQTQIRNQGNVVVDVNMVNTFQLPKSWIIEFSGMYHSPEKYAFDHIRSLWALNFGVQKKILKNRGVIKLSVNDIFFTSNISANVHFTDYDEHFIVKRDVRVAMLSFTYKFGKSTVGVAKRRGNASDDLKGRIQVGG